VKSIKLITAGNITIDDLVLPDGKTHMGTIGGDALYSALGARLWLDEVGVLTRANEEFMQDNKTKLKNAGLDLEGFKTFEEEIVRNWIIYDSENRRTFIYRNSKELLNKLSPEVGDIPKAFYSAKAIFLAAMPIENQLCMAKHFKEKGITTLLDPLDEEIIDHKEMVIEAIKYTDIFLPSADEVYKLSGSCDFEESAKKFASLGPRIVVIKNGADGCIVYEKDSDSFHTIPAYQCEVKDVTGAGDAFGGGFSAGYLLTNNPVEAAIMGSISSSFAIEDFGSLPLFNISSIQAKDRLKQFKIKLEGCKHGR